MMRSEKTASPEEELPEKFKNMAETVQAVVTTVSDPNEIFSYATA